MAYMWDFDTVGNRGDTVMRNKDFQKYIDLFEPVMRGVKEAFGDKIEFILHDLSTPQSSVAVVVGDITHRQVGAPSTNIVIEALKQHGDHAKDILGYPSVSKDGRPLRSSTIFIRDEQQHIVGCFCFNIDLTDFYIADNLIKGFCTLNPLSESKESNEVFAQDIGEVVEDIIQYEINNFSKPVPLMSRNDKLKLVDSLESKGVFDVKGAPEMVARALGASVFTIYNYIKEIRNTHKE